MAIARIDDCLPADTRVNSSDRKYQFGPFCMDYITLARFGGRFDWQGHINKTFYTCMAGVMDRFTKVV